MVSPCTGLPVHFLLSIVLEFEKVISRGGIHWNTAWQSKRIRHDRGALNQQGQRPFPSRSECPYPSHCSSTRFHLQPLPGPILFFPWDFSPLYWPPRAPVWPCVCRFARSGGLRIRLRTGASGPALEAHFRWKWWDRVVAYNPGLPRSGKRLCVFNPVFSTWVVRLERSTNSPWQKPQFL